MLKIGSERYANPEAPDGFTPRFGGDSSGRLDTDPNTSCQLSNSDFRKLLMTPKDPSTVKIVKPISDHKREQLRQREAAERRRKKKLSYAKFRREEVEKQAEMEAKYRDRAKERRDGKNPDYEHTESSSLKAGYRAVGPTARDISITAELRKQAIQESKYLGGDMEHTHLVKGLDYALLQKVRSEISTREREKKVLQTEQEKTEKTDESKITSAIAKNVYRILFQYKPPEKNEFFAAGRMAYAISMEDEDPDDTDVPITLIRSKSEMPTATRHKGAGGTAASGEMDMFVINKLTQVLSYLRQDVRSFSKKNKRKDRSNLVNREDAVTTVPPPLPALPAKRPPAPPPPPPPLPPPDPAPPKNTDLSIYGDVGEYTCDTTKRYKYSSKSTYAECYPGSREAESDEEADYSKMDNGTKKGPITRWDFANEEAYSEYQLQREAMPKAAFQYGVKMNDGRKTKKSAGRPQVDKHKSKIDRDFNKIMKIIRDQEKV